MAETSKQAGAYKRLREAAGKAEKCSAEAQELLDQYNCDREMAKKLKAIVATAQEVSAEVDGSAEDATGPRYAARAFEARRIAEEVSRKKRELMGDKEQPIAKKRPALGNLNNRVRFSIEAAPKSAKKSAKTHGKENTPKKKTASITPPPNGRAVFSPREAAEKVATSANAAATKRELIKKGYVKCGMTQLHYLATRWKNGDHIDEVWGRKGAKPLMEVEEVDQMVVDESAAGLKAVGTIDLVKKLTQRKVDRTGDRHLTEQQKLPSKNTISKYSVIQRANPDATEITKPLNKTPVRFTAGTSIRNTISFIFVAAVAQFLPGLKPPQREPALLSDGAKRATEMVRGCSQERHAASIHPTLLFNVDDSSIYFRIRDEAGAGTAVEEVFVIPKGTDTSVQGAYTLRKRNINLNEGVVVRSTNGANAAGMLLPTVLTFTGIDLDLKKHPSGVVWVEIAGLSPSAVTTPSMAKTKGYVCLLAEKDAEGKSPEAAHFAKYNELVMDVTIDEVREKVHSWEPGTEVPALLTSCTWYDGAGPQLKALVDEATMATGGKEEPHRKIRRRQHPEPPSHGRRKHAPHRESTREKHNVREQPCYTRSQGPRQGYSEGPRGREYRPAPTEFYERSCELQCCNQS